MSHINIQIRLATVEDLEQIFSFIRQKAAFDGYLDELQATPQQLEKTLFGRSPLARVLLAEVDNCAIAFALFFYTYSSFLAKPSIWLDDLFVQPHMRGQGVGTALLNYLSTLASENDCGRIEWTVNANNNRGIEFYQKQGAQILDRIRLCRLSY
ncbi:GNAT family N-acetyltransferase [cyanobacterium TDX16]|nr:GNAT family N-acetyltransferase [cyanobacterium TDX16]